MEQKSILTEALEITSHDRQTEYGPPEDNFRWIAEYWSVYVEHRFGVSLEIIPKDVAYMMALMKLAREDRAHKRDNLVDLCGYVRCASLIEGDEKC